MNARERILARLRKAPARATAPNPDVSAYFVRYTRFEDEASRLQRFKSTMEASHAEVFLTDNSSWPKLVQRIARDKGLRNLMVGTEQPHVDQLAAQCGKELTLTRYEQPADAWRN